MSSESIIENQRNAIIMAEYFHLAKANGTPDDDAVAELRKHFPDDVITKAIRARQVALQSGPVTKNSPAADALAAPFLADGIRKAFARGNGKPYAVIRSAEGNTGHVGLNDLPSMVAKSLDSVPVAKSKGDIENDEAEEAYKARRRDVHDRHVNGASF